MLLVRLSHRIPHGHVLRQWYVLTVKTLHRSLFLTFFSSSGFTCGTCDAKLREDLQKPCCIGCQRLYLNKDPDKKKKRGKASTPGPETPAAQSAVATAPNRSSAELYNRYKAAKDMHDKLLETYPNPEEMPEPALSQYDLAVKIMRDADQASAVSEATAQAAVKTVTAAADKRGSKRRKMEVAVQPVARASASAEEDRAVRQKRNNRSLKKLGSDDWYTYTIVDKNTFSKDQVYVCSICGHDRAWLRELEPYCTVQEFTFLLRSRITTSDEAKRILNIGHYFNSPVMLHPDQINKVNKLIGSVGVAPINPRVTAPGTIPDRPAAIPTPKFASKTAKGKLSDAIKKNAAKFRESMPKKNKNKKEEGGV
jgi:hypothetical protein